jgi:hypothetical protein
MLFYVLDLIIDLELEEELASLPISWQLHPPHGKLGISLGCQ